MSRTSRNTLCFSPDMYSDHNPTIFHKNTRATKVAGNKKRVVGILTLRSPETRKSSSTPVKFLKSFGAKVTKALQFVSINRSSRKVSSSATLTRSRSLVDPIDDSHRAEAIEDCIEFLNSSSSSSFQRSNSVSAGSCR